jgi:uncharacterized protein YkwD
MGLNVLRLLAAAFVLIGCGSGLSGLPKNATGYPSDSSQVGSGDNAPKPVPVDPVPVDPVPVDPVPVTPSPSPNTEPQTALELVNVTRSKARNCGGIAYPAVPAVVWNSKLEAAARTFNQDMISAQFFDHIGPNGSTPGSRVQAQGYGYTVLGENIALGSAGSSLDTVSGAVQAWLLSSGHCKNIMNADFTEMGLVGTPGKWNGTDAMYWTQVLAHPN